jgi:hypothetical protein
MKSIETTVLKTISLSPERISLFGYAHVPWMKKHQKLIPADNLPDSKLRMDMYDLASRLLEEHGYISVGLDHFAKKPTPWPRPLGPVSCSEIFRVTPLIVPMHLWVSGFPPYAVYPQDMLKTRPLSGITNLPSQRKDCLFVAVCN